jgi:predicted porin
MGRSQKDATATRKKISASDIGVSYTMGDITVVATSARGTEANTNNRKDTYQNVGVSYAVAPGVTAMIETASYDRSDDNQYDGQSTWVALAIDF